jgi:RNA polymerase-binding protein DksA
MTTVTDTDRFRQLLVEERARVQAALEHLHGEHRGSLEDETDEIPSDNHLAETASATLEREIDDTLEESAEHVLAAIDAALERIEIGTYGTCERCGNPIAEERLEALPYATLCIDDKRREERG